MILGLSSSATGAGWYDAFDAVLRDLRLTNASYCRNELSAPWGLEMPREPGARFHFVARGQCWLRRLGREPVRLDEGDVALLPHGEGHVIASDPDAAVRPIGAEPLERVGESTFALRTGGGGRLALMVCCTVGFAEPMVHPPLELMPELLLVRARTSQDPRLPMLLDTMADEVIAGRLGAATVMTRLADIVVTRVIRAWAEAQAADAASTGSAGGWLAAARDPQVGRALAAIHRAPADAWSVATLARAAGMSRSLFSNRFAAAVGLSPARYVARWRLHLASELLQDMRVTVAEVSARIGFSSEAAFSRAFKRVMGASPTSYRLRLRPRPVSAARR